MDRVVIGFISLIRDYPLIGFALALVIFGLLLLLKKRLLILMSPEQQLNRE